MQDGLNIVEARKVQIEQPLNVAEGLSRPGALQLPQHGKSLFREQLDKAIHAVAVGGPARPVCVLEDLLKGR